MTTRRRRKIYFERQSKAYCGVHCVNNLLQNPLFHENDFMRMAKELDAQEKALLTCVETAPTAAAPPPPPPPVAAAAAPAEAVKNNAPGDNQPKEAGNHNVPPEKNESQMPKPSGSNSSSSGRVSNEQNRTEPVPAASPAMKKGHSEYFDAYGNFSVSVLLLAFQRAGVMLTRIDSDDGRACAQDDIQGYVFNLRQHWFCVRRIGGAGEAGLKDYWWALDSLKKNPIIVTPEFLTQYLGDLKEGNWDIFIVTGKYPKPAYEQDESAKVKSRGILFDESALITDQLCTHTLTRAVKADQAGDLERASKLYIEGIGHLMAKIKLIKGVTNPNLPNSKSSIKNNKHLAALRESATKYIGRVEEIKKALAR